MANEAKVSLIIQIKNLAKKELDSFRQSLRNLGAEAKELLSSRLLQAVSLGAIAIGLRKAFQATDELEQSQRTLAATSQLTGASLEELFGIANRLKEAFSLDDNVANQLTETITKLTVQAGRFNETQKAAAAFLELGAARGFTVAETMQALASAQYGVYRGAQRLLGQNVEEMFQKHARAIGVSVGELTQAEKTQALLTAAIVAGEGARGSYDAWLQTAAGHQHILNLRINDAQVAFGTALKPLRLLALEGFAFVAGKIRDFVGGIQLLAVDLAEFGSKATAFGQQMHAWVFDFLATLQEIIAARWPGLAKMMFSGSPAELRAQAEQWRENARRIVEAAREGAEEVRGGILADFNAPPAGAAGGTGTGVKPPEGAPDTRAVVLMQKEIQKLQIAYRDGQLSQVEFGAGLDAIRERAREAAKVADEGSDAWTGYQQVIDSTTSSINGVAEAFFKLVDAQREAEDQWDQIINTAINWREIMKEMATTTLQEFAGVIEQTFAAIVDSSAKAGQAFKVAMLNAIAAIVRALGQMMLVKAGENIAKAIEFPFAAGKFLAAAAKYAAVAALAFAVAGGLGGAAANTGGGGGGGGSLSGQSAQEAAGASERGAGTINIQGGLLDMSDPVQADAFAAAIERLTGRRIIVTGA